MARFAANTLLAEIHQSGIGGFHSQTRVHMTSQATKIPSCWNFHPIRVDIVLKKRFDLFPKWAFKGGKSLAMRVEAMPDRGTRFPALVSWEIGEGF